MHSEMHQCDRYRKQTNDASMSADQEENNAYQNYLE